MTSTINALRLDVNREVEAMLREQKPIVLNISPELEPLLSQLENMLQGGKRLRPLFGYCGLRVAGGTWNDSSARALAALEFLQACALIHDDVMDDSKTRRNNVAVHEYFKQDHESKKMRGNSYLYGIGSAILLGDLCLSWADQMLMLATDFSKDVKAVWDITRTELMAGQYLDLLAQTSSQVEPSALEVVMTYKSAKYTVERPMHIGAALVRRDKDLEASLSRYALPLGKAFQLRDDVLGVFGNEAETGKPSGDDIREGKYTMLISQALSRANSTEQQLFESVLGNSAATDSEIDEIKTLLDRYALLEIEVLIQKLAEEASQAVDTLETDTETQTVMRELVTLATARKQ